MDFLFACFGSVTVVDSKSGRGPLSVCISHCLRNNLVLLILFNANWGSKSWHVHCRFAPLSIYSRKSYMKRAARHFVEIRIGPIAFSLKINSARAERWKSKQGRGVRRSSGTQDPRAGTLLIRHIINKCAVLLLGHTRRYINYTCSEEE